MNESRHRGASGSEAVYAFAARAYRKVQAAIDAWAAALAAHGRTRAPTPNALVKFTAEGSKVLLTLPAQGRALVKRVPAPVQVEIAKLSSRGAHVCREIFAGVLVVGLIAIVAGYGRLAHGPISLPSLVPPIEAAINEQLSGLQVKIDDAVLQRAGDGPGVLFRLRNIRLIDEEGSIVAQAPLAAIGMSGSALLSGRLAPGSVDFIGPRLLLFYNAEQGLSLSFSRPAGARSDALIRGSIPAQEPSAADPPLETTMAKRPETPVGAGGRKLDLTSTVTEVFERARRGDTSYLSRFGFKDALVVLNQDGTQTLWHVPDFAIDLEHRNRRSILVGQANVASSRGDWQLEVRTEQRTKRQSLTITALIQDLVPSGIAGNFPSIGALRALDMAVDGETTVELSESGKFLSGEATLRMASGQITPPWDPDTAMRIDRGDLQLRYQKEEDVVEIRPSTLQWGKSQATISGTFRPARGPDGAATSWDFALKADDAVFALEEFGLGPMTVDEWSAIGTISPAEGRVTLSRFVIRSGDASIAFAGEVIDAEGSPEVHLTGEVSPMQVDTLKQLWPKFLAGKARGWVLERVAGGEVLGGRFAVNLAPGQLAEIEKGGEVPPGAIDVELGLAGMSIAYIKDMPPVVTEEARLTVSGIEFSVDIPRGRIAVPGAEEIALSEGRFYIPDLRVDPQQGVITFQAKGATSSVLHLLDHEPLGYLQSVGMKPDFIGGTAEGGFTLSMPLFADLEFKDIKLNGMARLNDAIAAGLFGEMDIEGGGLDVNLTEEAIDARGDIQIKGVPAQLAWQRIFDAPDDRQPPIRVTATLDDALRDQLGMKLNHIVKGPATLTLSVKGLEPGAQAMNMQADLTKAQLQFHGTGWTKPAGSPASAQLDVVRNPDGSTDLQNLKVLGEDLAIHGSIALDPEQRLKSFHISDFSVSLLTQVEITGTVRDDQVLDIKAEGPSYDGKRFFQSLFSIEQLAGDSDNSGESFSGIDLYARIGTLIGFHDTTATNVEVNLKKRGGRLVALDGTADLNGASPAAVRLEDSNGQRLIKAEAQDAGAAFRLIGFYRSVEGGDASLQVNLDAGGQGTKNGTLWARDFNVVGDPVVNDVLTDPSSTAMLGDRKQETVRARIAFDQLRAPFSVGAGKFRLKDAYINGPQLGATLRGTVDFKSQTVNLGGTYIPLYGLNSAFRAIPILGPVLGGRQGEGLVGITFAIKGDLDDPSVLVNPMSVMTPGIFRQIFEFTGSVPDSSASANAPFAAPQPLR